MLYQITPSSIIRLDLVKQITHWVTSDHAYLFVDLGNKSDFEFSIQRSTSKWENATLTYEELSEVQWVTALDGYHIMLRDFLAAWKKHCGPMVT